MYVPRTPEGTLRSPKHIPLTSDGILHSFRHTLYALNSVLHYVDHNLRNSNSIVQSQIALCVLHRVLCAPLTTRCTLWKVLCAPLRTLCVLRGVPFAPLSTLRIRQEGLCAPFNTFRVPWRVPCALLSTSCMFYTALSNCKSHSPYSVEYSWVLGAHSVYPVEYYVFMSTPCVVCRMRCAPLNNIQYTLQRTLRSFEHAFCFPKSALCSIEHNHAHSGEYSNAFEQLCVLRRVHGTP